MLNENTELLDAIEFKARLFARVTEGNEEGLRIIMYLRYIVPDWMDMRATLLYKYIQDMLKNAEDTRRFEIELILKRTIQLIPLMTIFFSAFGYLFYITYDTFDTSFFGGGYDAIADVGVNDEKGENFIGALILIAFINAFLSSHLLMISAYSQREQENWEYHIDYLQAVLGINLMRASMDGEEKKIIIRKRNTSFSRSIFMICHSLLLLSYITLIDFSLRTTFESNCELSWLIFCKPDNYRPLIFAIIGISFSIFTMYLNLRMESLILGKKRPTTGKMMYIELLEKILYYKKEYDEDNNTSK